LFELKLYRWARNFAICWDWLKSTVDFIEIGLIVKSVLLSNQQETCLVFNYCEALACPPKSPRKDFLVGALSGEGVKGVSLIKDTGVEQGSSETYTQSSESLVVGQIFDSVSGPSHKKPYPPNFIEWFIGFSEGDGCFGVDNGNNRISFIITQKYPQVLYYIKKTLGFGVIYQDRDNYYRYTVSNKVNLVHLIKIFSGRLVLEKTNIRYMA
jgi:hypothetical protein